MDVPTEDGDGVSFVIQESGEWTRSDLGRACAQAVEEHFTGLAKRSELEAALLRPELLDAGRSADGRHIMLLSDRGKATLDGAMWPGSIELRSKGAIPVTWPKDLIWSGTKAPRTRARKMSTRRGELLLRTSADAIAITCLHTGVVAIFRGGSQSPALLRLPLEEGLRLRAQATSRGVIVTVTSAQGSAAIVHLSDQGVVLSARSMPEIRASALLGDHMLVLTASESEPESSLLHILRPNDLTALAEARSLGFSATALALRDDGRLALSDGHKLLLGRLRTDEGVILDPLIELDPPTEARQEKEAPAPESSAPQPSPDLPPALEIDTYGPPAAAWRGDVGGNFELKLRLRSRGSAGQGVAIEAGGEALARGLVQLLEIEGGGRQSTFRPSEAGMRRATLEAMPIPAGIAPPSTPDPKDSNPSDRPEQLQRQEDADPMAAAGCLEITIRGRGIRPGSALLTIRAAVLKSSAPSLRWLRPIAIRTR